MLGMCSNKNCELLSDKNFCSGCGSRTIPYYMTCPHCKKQIGVKHSFCGECGKPIHEAVTAFVEQKRKEVKDKELEDGVRRSRA